MKLGIFAVVTAAFLALASEAHALAVHFYPGDHIYSYELAADRDAHSIMVQSFAVLNDGTASVQLSSLKIQLMNGDRVIDERTLGASELERAAGNGAALQGELWNLLDFQFGGDRLLPPPAHFASSTTLAPGEAILFGSQIFAYRGARDHVRVVVNDGAASGSIALRNTMSQTEYRLPVHGVWYVGNGPTFHGPHRWSPMEEFAFDLVQVDAQGNTHRGDGTRFSDYYAYGQPVYAAADGRVVTASIGQSEDTHAMQQPSESVEAYYTRLKADQMTRVQQGVTGIGGNYVVIDHGNGEFSFYAHLKPGSVRVHVGDTVHAGQQIGLVGSSGNSTEPHLHFQVCDSADPLRCAGIPIKLAPNADPLRNPDHAPQVGDFLFGG
jgi:murein DD-endopeptidase MepM/ murein hydrolase activator NlpD